MRAIITLSNPGNHGKTQTIINLSSLIEKEYPRLETISSNYHRSEVSKIYRVGNKVLALESHGDPKSGLKGRLEKIIQCNPENLTIVTASRTRGETPNDITAVAKEYGFNVIWTSNYVTYDKSIDKEKLNNLKAKHLLQMLQELKFIPLE